MATRLVKKPIECGPRHLIGGCSENMALGHLDFRHLDGRKVRNLLAAPGMHITSKLTLSHVYLRAEPISSAGDREQHRSGWLPHGIQDQTSTEKNRTRRWVNASATDSN